MKEAATKSYMKKGEAIVEANHKAIDAGATAFRKFGFGLPPRMPLPSSSPGDQVRYRPAGQNLLEPIDRWTATACLFPPSSVCADGQFETGRLRTKRGVAVVVPHWDETKCIQCNQCAYVCPHATIRPFAMTEDEAAAAPEATRTLDAMGPKARA